MLIFDVISASVVVAAVSILKWKEYLDVDQVINTLLVAALVIVTINYAAFTWRMVVEAKNQRMDSQRPQLVPVEGKDGVVGRLTSEELLSAKKALLCIKNIGVGPASNVSFRLELRGEDYPPRTGDLDETLTNVSSLGVGDERMAIQWKDEGTPFQIPNEQWLVISYDDLFGRHFQTEAQWNGVIKSWFYISTKQVDNPPKREDESQNPGLG